MNGITLVKRTELLENMNNIMMAMNNEEAYYEWIYEVPDEATKEDFVYMAEDKKRFDEVVEEFVRLVKKYGKDGLYVG